MSDYMIINGELYHHGVKGMKWGVRKARGHGGTGWYIGSNKRQLEKHKADLKRLNDGQHLSIGTTKKRQAEYDARDRAALDKKISKLEGDIKKKTERKTSSVQTKQYGRLEDAYSYKATVNKKQAEKTYGRLEDAMGYSKYSNKKANEFINKALKDLDRQMSSGNKQYDMKKINSFIDNAMKVIEEDLAG